VTLAVVVPPAVEPVSLAEMKTHLRIDITDDDSLISTLITAARDYIERVTRRTMIYTGYKLLLDTFPGWSVHLPRLPVLDQSAGVEFLTATPLVQYYNLQGVLTTLTAGTDYELDLYHNPPRLVLPPMVYWPWTQLGKTNAVQISFVAGYSADASLVPPLLKNAIKLLVSHWYNNREAVGSVGDEIALAIESICKIYSAGDYC